MRLHRVVLIAIAVSIIASATAGAAPGELCIANSPAELSLRTARCFSGETDSINVAPSESDRLFSWRSADNHRLVLGIIVAGAGRVDLPPVDPTRRVSLNGIRGTRPSFREATLTISSKDKRVSWETTLGSRAAAALVTIEPPSGQYILEITAEQHLPLSLEIKPATTLPSLVMRARPIVTGIVVDAQTGEPMTDVHVTFPDVSVWKSTDVSGVFVYEHGTASLPDHLTLSHPDRATKVITLPTGKTDVDLGRVPLVAGGNIKVNLVGDRVAQGPVTIDVEHAERDKPIRVSGAALSREDSSATIRNLEPGRYTVIAKGTGPLQRFAKEVEVKAGSEVELDMSPTPFGLSIAARLGDAPLSGGKITIENIAGRWTSTVLLDEQGSFDGAMWQPGDVAAYVRAPSLQQPFLIRKQIENDENHLRWQIDIPDQRISGRIVDRESGEPVPGAWVLLQTSGPDMQTTATAESANDGSYTFTAVRAGAQTVAARAEGFIASEPVKFRLEDGDPPRTVTVRLEKTATRAVTVVDWRAMPLAGAVIVPIGNAALSSTATDDAGRARVSVPAGTTATVLVVPREGSFAVGKVPAPTGSDASSIQLEIPRSAGSLLIRAVDGDAKPLRAVSVLIRYNGTFIPPSASGALTRVQNIQLTTGVDGTATLRDVPQGVYELWPFRTITEAGQIMRSGAPPAARTALTSGVTTVTLEFERKPEEHRSTN